MDYLFGVIAVLVGGIFFYRGKKNSAEGLLSNLTSLLKDLTIQKSQIKSQAKQELLQEQLKETGNDQSKSLQKANDSSVNDNLDYWNKRKS